VEWGRPRVRVRDLEWAVIRMCPIKLFNMDIARLNPSDQKVPGWSGFHVLVIATTLPCTDRLLPTHQRFTHSVQHRIHRLKDSAEDDGQCVTAGMRHHI
jgi:hypothetical protein